MFLKNRVAVYSWRFEKIDYFNPYDYTTRVYVKLLDSSGNFLEYWPIPSCCVFPSHFEMYCKGLEDSWKDLKIDIHIERVDYEY